MSDAFYRYVSGVDLHSEALAPYGAAGIIFPTWYGTNAYIFSGGVISQTPISGIATAAHASGFCGAASDGASGAFLLQHSGALVQYSSGGTITAYNASGSGQCFTGLTSIATTPWMVDASGRVFNLTAGVVTLKGTFGSAPARQLAVSGTSLYSLLPNASGVGSFNTGTNATGFVATPMPVPAVIAASGALVAVGGWDYATLASGFVAMGVDHAVTTTLAGATVATSGVSIWANSGSGVWSFSQFVSGAGTPVSLTWAPNGNSLLTCDRVNGAVKVFTYAVGVLAFNSSLAVSGAAACAITLNSLNGLVCQPAVNQLTSLVASGSGWATSGTVAIANPKSAIARSNTEIAVGCSSGVALLELSGGVWTVGSVTSLSFVPTALALDNNSNIIAAGANGASGVVYASGGTASYVGSVSGLIWLQGQIAVADNSNSLIRIFSSVSGVVTASGSVAAPTSVTALTTAPQTIFAASSSATWEYNFTAPYSLPRVRSGEVSIYNGSTWNSAILNVGQRPTAIGFDVSGNVAVTTSANTLYTISSGGSVVSSGTIAQFTGQPQATPIGLSAILLFSGSLYATTSLNDSFVKVT